MEKAKDRGKQKVVVVSTIVEIVRDILVSSIMVESHIHSTKGPN